MTPSSPIVSLDDPKALKSQIQRLRKDLLFAQANMREEILRESRLFENRLTKTEREAIESVFQKYDKDNDGEISIGELGNFFKALGEPLTEDETHEAMELMSRTNTSGKIQLADFINFWIATHKNGSRNSAFIQKFKMANSVLLKAENEFNINNIRFHRSGDEFSLDYRVHFYYMEGQELRRISAWHDIPLYNTGYGENATIFNYVNEIPKYTRAKYEIATRESYNPIKQDVRNGRVRFYQHGDLCWNYGMFPQTFEDPSHVSPETGCPGDNDPIDVIEIGARQIPVGAVVPVKLLGVIALIDDGETDWKNIAISVNDPMAHLLNNIDDVDRELPGLLNAIREYFRKYKVCTGKEENSYGLDGRAMDRKFAVKVVFDTHMQWKKLRETQRAPTPVFTPQPKQKHDDTVFEKEIDTKESLRQGAIQ